VYSLTFQPLHQEGALRFVIKRLVIKRLVIKQDAV